MRVARTELQPWAMLANGPPWTKAGTALGDWTRLGRRASLRIAAIDAGHAGLGGQDGLAGRR